MARRRGREFISALLYILIGVLLIVFRSKMLGWAMTFGGVFFIVSGVIDLFRKNFGGGAISLIIGIAILVLGWTAAQIVFIVLGVLLAIKGLIALINAIKTKGRPILAVVFPAITIAAGVLLAMGKLHETIIMIGGIILIADGVLGLIDSFRK